MRKAGRYPVVSRREFLRLTGFSAGVLAAGGRGVEAFTRQAIATPADGTPGPGRVVEQVLEAAPLTLDLGGRGVSTWGYNGTVPGPEIRVTEGDLLRVIVRNRLPEGTSVHWHGLPIPNAMDGVPGVTQPPIASGRDFTYEFVVPVAGTYLYHSHVVLQLDRGLYGPLIVEPANEPLAYDREFMLTLDDWLDGLPGTPDQTFARLRSEGSQMAGMDDMAGMSGENEDEATGTSGPSLATPPPAWPPDIVYPRYLINGRPADQPAEFVVRRGDRVRLRLGNPGSATIFRVALAGHRLTVTHADGLPVEPVTVDALRIGMGERYDVLVEADNPGTWQLAAQAEGTDLLARAIVRYQGSTAAPPPADAVPAELERRLLLYAMLTDAGAGGVPTTAPDQRVPIVLDGNEDRYVWTINGQAFPDADPIPVTRDGRIRFEIENRSEMPHPMHLHGHSFRVDTGTGRGPVKDTVVVEPAQRLAIDWVADNPGDWAFHCHQTYHAEAGMTRVIRVA